MRYNVLKSCAALSCRACVDETTCVAEQYLTLRTGCSRGRTPKVVRPQQRKNPLPYSFSPPPRGAARSAPDPEARDRQKSPAEGSPQEILPFAPRKAPNTPALRSSQLPSAEFRCRKGAARSGRTRLTAVRAPRFSGTEKAPPGQGEHAHAVRVPRSAGAENKSRV